MHSVNSYCSKICHMVVLEEGFLKNHNKSKMGQQQVNTDQMPSYLTKMTKCTKGIAIKKPNQFILIWLF